MELYDVVTKLVGPIHPVGSHGTDERHYENLKVMDELIWQLVRDVSNVAENETRHEASMKKAGEKARCILKELQEYVND